MAFFKKAMNYLGLGPDDAYDEYDMPMEPAPGRGPRSSYGPETIDSGTVRTVPAGAAPRPQAPAPGGGDGAAVGHGAGRTGSAVRTMPAGSAPRAALHGAAHALRPRQEVADNFKEGVPVIVNLRT
jgi:cell division inhibitor SepF